MIFSNISETIFISHRLILPENIFIRLYLLFNINLDKKICVNKHYKNGNGANSGLIMICSETQTFKNIFLYCDLSEYKIEASYIVCSLSPVKNLMLLVLEKSAWFLRNAWFSSLLKAL